MGRAASLLLLVGLAVAPTLARAEPSADAMIAELNKVRTNPQAYGEQLREEWRNRDRTPELEPEDPAAVADALAFLAHHAPEPPLTADERLQALAQGYVDQQGPTGQVGHTGPVGDGFPGRFAALHTTFQNGGEVIAYGPVSTHDAVRQLIIDSGVPDRGHRTSIFDPDFSVAGAACGPHRKYRTMCIVDFAGRPYTPRKRLGEDWASPFPPTARGLR